MRAATTWVHENARSFNADPGRIYATGHSAGGQLAGTLAGTDWPQANLPADLIKGVCGISGLYDLEPVRRSNVNDWLRLDAESAARNSPSANLPAVPTPLLAVAGENETSEFCRQTLDFGERWAALGYPADARILAGLNHYSIVLEYLNPSSALTLATRELVGA
jgi:arylformamidase